MRNLGVSISVHDSPIYLPLDNSPRLDNVTCYHATLRYCMRASLTAPPVTVSALDYATMQNACETSIMATRTPRESEPCHLSYTAEDWWLIACVLGAARLRQAR